MDDLLNTLFVILALSIMIALCWYCVRIEKNWATPLSLLCIWSIPSVILDGLYTLFTGTYGVREEGREIVNLSLLAMSISLWTLGILSFAVAYWWLGSKTQTNIALAPSAEKRNDIGALLPEVNSHGATFGTKRLLIANDRRITPTQQLTLNIILMISATASLLAMYGLVTRAQSLGVSFWAISGTRNLVIADGGGLLLMTLQLYKYAILLLLFHQFRAHSISRRAIIINTVLVCSLDLLVGTRSAMINGFILPGLIGYHIMFRKINLAKLMLPMVLLVLVLSPLYRSLTRDVHFAKNSSKTTNEVLMGNFQTVPAMIFGGFEISSLDATMDVMNKYENPQDRQVGSTFLIALTSMVPRSLWEKKPYGGASTIYTERFYPANYGAGRAELLTSYTGELYMNFGLFAIPVGFALVGYLFGVLNRRILRGNHTISCLSLLIYTTLVMRFFNLLRGDTFNFMSQIILNLLAISFVLSLYFIINASVNLLARRH